MKGTIEINYERIGRSSFILAAVVALSVGEVGVAWMGVVGRGRGGGRVTVLPPAGEGLTVRPSSRVG